MSEQRWVVTLRFARPIPDGLGSHEWVEGCLLPRVKAKTQRGAGLAAESWLRRHYEVVDRVKVLSVLLDDEVETDAKSEGIEE
jgi:hypothetical protein